MALMSALALYAPAVKQFLATAASKATIWELLEFVHESLGAENARRVTIGLWVIGAFLALWILRAAFLILRTPAGSKMSSSSATTSKRKPQGKNLGHKTETSEQQPAEVPRKVVVPPLVLPRAPEAAAHKFVEKRTRPLQAHDPSSTIRGFPRVGALAVSPSQQFLIATCRKTHKCYLYPQNKKRQFMEKGKELQAQHFTNLGPLLGLGDDAASKVDVPSVAFSVDGAYVALAESSTDSIYTLKLQPLGLAWVYKLPKGRLASSLHAGRWGICATVNPNVPDAVVVVHDKDAEVEVMHHLGQQKSLVHRFKIGNASAWGIAGRDIAVGGTFMKEARVSSISMRDVSSMSVDKRFVWAPRAAKLRAFALVVPKSPDFNTRHLLVCYYDDGFGEVLDVSCEDAPEVKSIGTFTDIDFAADCKSSCHLVAAVGGQGYHEELSIALWAPCGDAAVWRGAFSANGLIELKHVADLHDMHDGDTVTAVQFIQFGAGIATAGDNDDRHVRLWALPAAQAK